MERDKRIQNLNDLILKEINILWESEDEGDQKALTALANACVVLESYLYPMVDGE